MTPTTQAIEPGGVATYLVEVTASGNFSASVALMAASPSPSLTVGLVPSILTPTDQATLTLTDTHPAGPLLPGLWYSLPLTAAGGGLTQTTTFALLVGGARLYLPVILE